MLSLREPPVQRCIYDLGLTRRALLFLQGLHVVLENRENLGLDAGEVVV